MEQSFDPTDPPAAPTPPDEPAADCERVLALLGRYTQRGLGAADDAVVREHIAVCSTCGSAYRTALAMAARIGRTIRTERLEGTREERRRETRRRILALEGGGKRRWFGLRLALIPAFLVVLFTGLDRFGGGGSALVLREVEAEGPLEVAGVILFPETQVELEPGQACRTGAGGAGRLQLATAELALDGETDLVLESLRPGRIRLERGRLGVEGELVVSTHFGILEFDDAQAVLTLRGGVLELELARGTALVTSAAGERELGAGERLRFDATGSGN